MKEHEEGYAMPLSAPTFTPPPFESTERSQILLVLYRGDPDAVAWEVPEPLEPFGDGTMLAWVGDMCQPSHTLDLYRECLTAIKVRYGDTIGWYVNFIWVAHDMALLF
ncbi:MAG: acetoacetate decarboxylase family protein, partial [Alphaproteobacteria bacterium]